MRDTERMMDRLYSIGTAQTIRYFRNYGDDILFLKAFVRSYSFRLDVYDAHDEIIGIYCLVSTYFGAVEYLLRYGVSQASSKLSML